MAEHLSPSPLIECFARAVAERLPQTQQEKLAPLLPAIERTTDRFDGRRARRCAHWAIETAGQHDLAHHEWRSIVERHEVWKDLVFGAEFGILGEGAGLHPLEDAELEWVDDAVNVAGIVGHEAGWADARWDQLLEELIAMEPSTAG